MSKTSGDSRSGVMVGFGALAVVIVCAAAYYGSMTGSENAAGTVMQAERYKADSTTGPTPTPTTADTQHAGQPTGGGANTGTAAANQSTVNKAAGKQADGNRSAQRLAGDRALRIVPFLPNQEPSQQPANNAMGKP